MALLRGFIIKDNLFRGDLVRLTSEDPEESARTTSSWARNSEYQRLLDTEQAELWSAKKRQEWREKDLDENSPDQFFFYIRTLEDDKLIGFVGLFGVAWIHGDAWVGIGIGERDAWGKGYGTDAMRLILKFAFTELNLHRVTLGVFAYNTRAIRSYEKAGFILEGTEREALHRDGSHADGLYMGILREDWKKMQS